MRRRTSPPRAWLGGKEFTFKLSDALKKGPVVMYFFPAAYTAGCTTETKAFADAADDFKAAGATLVGLTGGAKLADGTMANAKDNLARLARSSRPSIAATSSRSPPSRRTRSRPTMSCSPQKPDWSDRTVLRRRRRTARSAWCSRPRCRTSHINKTLEAVKAYKAAHH